MNECFSSRLMLNYGIPGSGISNHPLKERYTNTIQKWIFIYFVGFHF
jgi:hypothetical protein